jgi:hypothetical protein
VLLTIFGQVITELKQNQQPMTLELLVKLFDE